MTSKLVILCITSLFLLIPIAGATYDVVSGIASNSTEYTTSASYAELHNLSLATGTGTVFIKASWDARLNFTAPLYGRFLRDGVSLGRFNLTQSVYAQVGSYELALNETTGTHYYGWEVYSNKKGTIYSRNFSAVFLANGTYGTGAGGNITSITGAPAGVLDCTGTDDITCTISPTGANFRNDTITTQGASISALQVNDSYFNGTVFPNSTNFRNDSLLPISTYSGNFPNTTIAGYNGNYPNTSLTNYLLISMYAGNFPNSSLSNYLLTSLFATNFNTSFHAEIPQCTSGQKLNSTDGETLICDTDATGAAGGNVSSVTAQSPLTYTGTTDVVIKDERTTYPNATVAANLDNWNATYNATYAVGTMGASFSNGTNNIAVGTKKKMRQATAGIITALYVNQTDDVACSGNVTVTSSGAYKSHIAWSSAANASSTGLSVSFTSGEWLLYNMTENTGCIDFTFVQVHTKTS